MSCNKCYIMEEITKEFLEELFDTPHDIFKDDVLFRDELEIFEDLFNNGSLPLPQLEETEMHYNCHIDCDDYKNGLWLKCGEVRTNSEGLLMYKCLLCSNKEFSNAAEYEEHLHIQHPQESQKNLQTENATIYFDNSLQGDDDDNLLQIDNIDKRPSEKLSGKNIESGVSARRWKVKKKHVLPPLPSHNKSLNAAIGGETTDLYGNGSSDNIFKSTSLANEEYTAVATKKKRTPGYCDICQRSFNDLYNLRVHMMIHTGEMPHQCEDCGKRFRQYNKLKIHRITHTNQKPFICDICNKGFRFRNYLAIHKRLHSGEKPYKCNFCSDHFHSLHSRRVHMKLDHAETKTFSCPICEKILTAQCYLTAHMKRHKNERDFKCDRCDKSFFGQSQLKDHKMSHSNEKPHECGICHTRFQRKSNYIQHLKIHSDIKTYVCHICKKAFAQNAGLYAHMKSHKFDDNGER